MLAELGYGFAYRVLDAQYFGVAQRRRRVFVVGHLGDWHRAAAVLFERHSLCGHPAPSREARQDSAKCLTASLGMRLDPETETFPIVPKVAETLIASDHKGPGHNRDHNFVAQPMAFPWQSALDPIGNPENLSGTLIKNQTMAVAQPVGFDSYNLTETGDVMQTIKSPQGGVTESVGAVRTAMQVRRLTPVECERLQGFPDNYTNIPWRKKLEAPDGPRYKAMGNSMAVPVMAWIGRRIAAVQAL